MTGYIIGAILVIVALGQWALRQRSNSIKARNITGNVQVGNVSGSVNQTFSASSGLPPSKPSPPDRVAWAIGIVGVLVAVAQLVHDVFWAK
jgi:hypothetical protein